IKLNQRQQEGLKNLTEAQMQTAKSGMEGGGPPLAASAAAVAEGNKEVVSQLEAIKLLLGSNRPLGGEGAKLTAGPGEVPTKEIETHTKEATKEVEKQTKEATKEVEKQTKESTTKQVETNTEKVVTETGTATSAGVERNIAEIRMMMGTIV